VNGRGPSPFPGTVPGTFRTDRGRRGRPAALHREPGFFKASRVPATRSLFSPVVNRSQYFKHCNVHPSADAPQALCLPLVGNLTVLDVAARHSQAASAARFLQVQHIHLLRPIRRPVVAATSVSISSVAMESPCRQVFGHDTVPRSNPSPGLAYDQVLRM
jgi:hypothetical protein